MIIVKTLKKGEIFQMKNTMMDTFINIWDLPMPRSSTFFLFLIY